MKHPVPFPLRVLAVAATLLALVAGATAESADPGIRFPVEVRVVFEPGRPLPVDSPHVRLQNRAATFLTATVDATGYGELQRLGFAPEPLSAWQPGRGAGYPTYPEMEMTLAAWAAAHPDRAQLLSVGTSVQGRDLWAMRITAAAGTAPVRPACRILGGMHGDEPVGVEVALRLIRALLDEYGVTPRITRLVNNTDVYVLPLLNPDGYASAPPRRNNCISDLGVDLNRDFPTPGEPNTTAGRAPETAAVMTWAQSRIFALAINLHGGALGAVYPWGHAHDYTSLSAQNPETPLFQLLALTYAASQPALWAITGGGWVHGTTNGCQWYATNGGELADWQYRAHGCPELTLELTTDKAPACGGLDQPFPEWDAHRTALLEFIENVHRGIRGRVRRDDGAPLTAQIGVGVRRGCDRGTGVRVSCQLRLEHGWNLVALPFCPDNPAPEALFPGKSGPCWTWTGEQYAIVTSFQPGLAAWVLNRGPANTVTIAGVLEGGANLVLRPGWTLAGTLGRAFSPPVSQVSGISTWNGAAQAYVSVLPGTRLDPLAGYWFCAPAQTTVSTVEPVNAPVIGCTDSASGAYFRVLEPGRYPLWFADTAAAAIQAQAPSPVAAGEPVILTVAYTSPAEPLQLLGLAVPDSAGPDGLPGRCEQDVTLARASNQCEVVYSRDGGATWERVAMTALRGAGETVQATVNTVAGQADLRYGFELYRNGEKVAALGSQASPLVLTLARSSGPGLAVRGATGVVRRHYGLDAGRSQRRIWRRHVGRQPGVVRESEAHMDQATNTRPVPSALPVNEDFGRVMELSVENAPESVLWMGPDSRVLYANATIASALGWSREQVVGLDLADIEPAMTADVWALHWSDLKQRGALTYESTYRRRDGTLFPVEISARYFCHHGREYHCAFARDISDRQTLEAQFLQSQRLESVGRLAGGMAHDFNNLLTIINGYSEMLLEVLPENDASRRELEEIRRAGKQAAALTQQLLAFSRRQVLKPRVFDLNRVVADMEAMLRRLIGEDITLGIRLGAESARVKADPAKIEQVVMNLVVNARDAMPRGGRLAIETISVDLDEEYAFRHPDVTPGPYVLLAVSDTGMGMSKEAKAHLFEPFFTTKAKGQGTGLGLSTAYGVVMQSGGHIVVYSEEGHGTNIKIYLPRVTAEGAVEEAKDVPLLSSGRGSETVLLAEDEDGVRTLISGMLRMRGYTVLEARNGLEALQIVERAQAHVDVVLTDVIMPNLSGRELADRLAKRMPDIPVIYMSGYTNETIVQYGVLDSGRPFLQKPFSAAALTQLLRHVLDSRGR